MTFEINNYLTLLSISFAILVICGTKSEDKLLFSVPIAAASPTKAHLYLKTNNFFYYYIYNIIIFIFKHFFFEIFEKNKFISSIRVQN